MTQSYYLKNKDRWKEYRQRWLAKNPAYGKEASRLHRLRYPAQKREQHLRYRYNLSVEQYQQMFEKQKGLCAICGIHQSELKRPLSIDHNHITGKIRGLLCIPCNNQLATLENKEYCTKASLYLQEYNRE
jgi:hypothetical protein